MFHGAPTEDAVLRRAAAVALIGTLIGTLIGAVLVTFGGTVGGQWLNLDDDVHVTANPHLNPVTGASLRRLWSAAYEDLSIPLAYTLFAAETQASRLLAGGDATAPPDPRLFHAVSLALHAANVLLVWSLLQRLAPGGIWPVMAGALLFAVHPLQVETVA
jgi:protein O-mannosyl-transferase